MILSMRSRPSERHAAFMAVATSRKGSRAPTEPVARARPERPSTTGTVVEAVLLAGLLAALLAAFLLALPEASGGPTTDVAAPPPAPPTPVRTESSAVTATRIEHPETYLVIVVGEGVLTPRDLRSSSPLDPAAVWITGVDIVSAANPAALDMYLGLRNALATETCGQESCPELVLLDLR
ncbi:MAG: hypothetical protein KC479_15295, partial [Dehalococcoidia bacterium]|nr:hypothetical protein [Dehalococcoidia bacterium]